MAKEKLGGIQLDETGQDWRVWQAGKPPKRDTEVTSGYWRVPGKGYATPVVTYFDEGMIIAKFPAGCPFLKDNPPNLDPDCGDDWHKFADAFWPMCEPVSDADLEKALEAGRWEDLLAVSPRDAMGGNNPPDAESERLLAEAREAMATAKKIVEKGAAKTQKAADAAANLEANMAKLRTSLGEQHKAEKEPHLRAGQAVDEKFNPVIKEMRAIGADLGAKVKRPFLQEQERIASAARVAAEAAAQKVIDDAKAAQAPAESEADAGGPLDEGWEQAAPKVDIAMPKVSAGGRGSRSSLRDVRYGVITDMTVFASALVENIRMHPELKNLLDSIAMRMARADIHKGAKDGEIIHAGMKIEIRRE